MTITGIEPSDRGGASDAPYYAGVADNVDFASGRPRWQLYCFALIVTLIAIGLRRWLDVLGDGIVPFSLFYPVVLVCALIGGIGPAVLSLTITMIAATVFWMEPRGAMAASPINLFNMVLFVTSNAAMIAVVHLLRTSYTRLRRSEARLSLSQDVGQIGIWDLDLKSGALWWSPSFYALTGFAPDHPPSIAAVLDRIHPADRERAAAALETARQGHDRLDLEFRFIREDGAVIWLVGRAELFRDAQGRPSRLLGINFDATPIRTVQSERDRAHTLLETFFDCLPGAAYVKDTEGRILLGNPVFAAAIGQPPEDFLGKTDLDFVPDPAQARAIQAHDAAVIASGVSQTLEEDLLRPDGSMSHWLSIKTPFRDGEGEAKGIVGISLDMTDRRRAEQRSRLLANEVDHRAMNLLGVVQSIVRLTRVEDVATFKSVLTGRIRALARAHSLLAASSWDGVDLATLVAEELAPFGREGTEQVHISGPALKLSPGASQALAMVLHELAINAARYGALSVDGGRLDVIWQLVGGGKVDDDSADPAGVELVWAETGGPQVVAPERTGFGFTTIHGAIEHQLAGAIGFDWAATGVTCRITFPSEGNLAQDGLALAHGQTEAPGPQPDPSPKATGNRAAELAGRCVLIVDDEALIALTLAEIMREKGCTVLGPAHSVDAALALIRQSPPDLAVLDLNLAGRSHTPVASALRALAIPFVYCTGYADPAMRIEPGLEAEVITKPTDPEALAAALRRAAAGEAPAASE